MKTCKRCKKEKQNEDFYTSKRNKDGRLGACKVCMQDESNDRYAAKRRSSQDGRTNPGIAVQRHKPLTVQQSDRYSQSTELVHGRVPLTKSEKIQKTKRAAQVATYGIDTVEFLEQENQSMSYDDAMLEINGY